MVIHESCRLVKEVGLPCLHLSERGCKVEACKLQVRLCKLDNFIGGFSISKRTHKREACSLRLEALPIQIPNMIGTTALTKRH